ncbi:MAG: amidohydrolase family protein [Bryobacterales bacterium]|nr:amidohydrolase family protein [Bryobacterales bacterium]
MARLKRRGVTQAWTGSFEGVFHRDLSAANARLARICEATGAGMLIPFGSVNPCAPGWREDLRRCHELHRMPGIRLHPNYHGYALDHPEVLPLLREARVRKLIVQIAIQLEDERTQHPLMRVAPVDPAPLASLAAQVPDLRMVILNRARVPAGPDLKRLAGASQVYFDLAMIEGAGCARMLVETVGIDRVVFGSHSPFQYFESALLKLKESDIAGDDEMAIVNGNAARLLTP